MIAFTCPNCGAGLEASSGQAGAIVKCSSCGGKMRVPFPEPERDDDVPEAPLRPSARGAQQLQPYDPPDPPDPDDGYSAANSKRLMAALIGLFGLGSFGVHKFILGYYTEGVILLLITVLTCGVGASATLVIGFIEGIIYLTKSDRDFYRTYVLKKRSWF